MGIEKVLRMYLLQIWFNLSDPATEDAIYDSYAMRKFTGINSMTERVPDETTLCRFRHLMEANGPNKLFFDAITRAMVQTGHMMKGGTIVDATIINAPSSTKNADKARDPKMHQTKTGSTPCSLAQICILLPSPGENAPRTDMGFICPFSEKVVKWQSNSGYFHSKPHVFAKKSPSLHYAMGVKAIYSEVP